MEIKLNLIPPGKKEEISRNKRVKMAIKAEVALTIIVVVFFAVLVSFKYILNISLSSEAALNVEIETADQFEKIKGYDNQFKQANEKIKQIASIDQTQLHWSNVFEKISGLIPDGIEIKSLTTNNYSINITGLSDTRDNLIEFKSKLVNDRCFSNIDLPLSNLVEKNDVEFGITLNINGDCLKK